MLMQILLVKAYIVSYRKMPKNHCFIYWQNPVKVKKYHQKSNNFNRVPAASIAGPCPTIIGLLFRFYNNVQTEWQLCRPLSLLRSRLITVCTVCPNDPSENLGSLPCIALMYFIRNNNSIWFQQIKQSYGLQGYLKVVIITNLEQKQKSA